MSESELPFYSVIAKLVGGRMDINVIPSWFYVILGTVILGTVILIQQLIAPWVERKTMGRQQKRRGPTYVGKWGILQIPADLMKLVLKEDTRPVGADKTGFLLSVSVVAITSIMAFAPLPWGTEGLISGQFSVGFLYIFALFSLFPPMMLIGGWSSNSKYSLIGGFRSAGQLIAYEIPMLLSILGVIATVGSLSLIDITEYQVQNGWFVFRYFGVGAAAFFIFFISAIAETERIPFDIPEDEASLVMGPRTEFASWRYALLMMVEYLHLWINEMLVIYFFWGGYDIGFGPQVFRTNGFVQFFTLLTKTYVVVFIAAWMRSALARFRIDQFLVFGWKWLLPFSILLMVGFLVGVDINVFGWPWPLGGN